MVGIQVVDGEHVAPAGEPAREDGLARARLAGGKHEGDDEGADRGRLRRRVPILGKAPRTEDLAGKPPSEGGLA